MVHIVLKAAPDADLYCVWSTESDRPIRIANRAGMAAYLREHTDTSEALNDPEGRLARADKTGTSAAGGFAFFGAWDYDLWAPPHGYLPRSALGRFLGVYFSDPDAAYALLEPYEVEELT